MKNRIFTIVTVIVLFVQFSFLSAIGQTRGECIPKTGYWVLVSNIHVKKVTHVQFYTDDHQLIYEEVVSGKKLDLKRLKTLRCLKNGLDSALIAWNLERKTLYHKDWIAANLRH